MAFCLKAQVQQHSASRRQHTLLILAAVLISVVLSLIWMYSSVLRPCPVHVDVSTGFVPKGAVSGTQSSHARDAVRVSDLGRIDAFIGIQVLQSAAEGQGDYQARRAAIRNTWMQHADAWQEHGIMCRFIIGKVHDARIAAELDAEGVQHGDIVRLPVRDTYSNLPWKSLHFFRYVAQHYESRFIVKVDDDVYVRLGQLQQVLHQWNNTEPGQLSPGASADYIGCMKRGDVIKDARLKWSERQHAVLAREYFTHSWGSIYVLSGRAAGMLAAAAPDHLRRFANEDVSIGAWMLAFNVRHLDDRRLCSTECSSSAVAVWDFPLPTPLRPTERLRQLHAQPDCGVVWNPIPTVPAFFEFVSVPFRDTTSARI